MTTRPITLTTKAIAAMNLPAELAGQKAYPVAATVQTGDTIQAADYQGAPVYDHTVTQIIDRHPSGRSALVLADMAAQQSADTTQANRAAAYAAGREPNTCGACLEPTDKNDYCDNCDG